MKRLSIAVLLALLAFSAAFAGAETAEEKMYRDWCGYLDECETQLALKRWAYEKAERFAETRSWEELLKARAASQHALYAMRAREPLQSSLTDDEILSLMLAGVEADVLLVEIENTGTLIRQNCISLESVSDQLHTRVFLSDDCGQLGNRMRMLMECDELTKGYLRYTGNYLMEQLKDKVDIQAYKEGFSVRWPGISGYECEWTEDENEIIRNVEAILDAYARYEAEAAGYVGETEYMVFMMEEAVQMGESEEFSSQLFDFSGEPSRFPMAAWMSPARSGIFYLKTDGETGEALLIEPLSETESIPEVMMIQCASVSQDETAEYLLMLDLCGIAHYDVFGETEEEDDLQSLIKKDGVTAMFTWNAGEATFYFTDPIGSLVPPIYMEKSE